MKTIDQQLTECLPDWTKLIKSLKGDILGASDDPSDDTPGMCLTIGFTPETEEKDYSWSYQTGDNSFHGGAYFHPHWAVVSIYRDSDAKELAEECADQLGELITS